MSIAQGTIPFQTAYEMDESFKVNRWGSGPTEEEVRQTFMRYASGGSNQRSRQQVEELRSGAGESQKRYVSEITQMSNIGDGFKKTKYNQMETLKQLRQQYQILRNLPMQSDFLKHSHTKKRENSEYQESRRESQSVSSSSKQTDHRNHRRNSSSQNGRTIQILTLQKRQLQLVIGNSMRKIEQLLNNEIQYKKVVHELQLQLDSRNNEDKIENLTKTMKRNESQLNERIQSLKREIERLKQINKQLQDKNDLYEAEVLAKNQEIRKLRDEKRKLQDEMRLEKDKFLSLEIDMKKVRMEYELLEKEKNTEINRLNGLLQVQPKDQTSLNELRRLEEELRNQKQRYEILITQFQRYKREVSDRPREIIRQKSNEDQLRIFEALITHLRQESANQNRASMDLINSMIAKVDERKKHGEADGNSRVLDELFHLRNEVTSLKRQKEVGDKSMHLIESMADYQHKIKRLEQEIADGTISKENLMKEYENVRSSLEYARQQYDKLNIQYQRLRERLNQSEAQGQRITNVEYQQTIRQLRRQLDEALFMIDKAKKEGEFNIGLIKNENEAALKLIKEQIARAQGEKELLRAELNKMKAYYEAKIQEKNVLLEQTASEFQSLCQTKEQTLIAYKSNSEREMSQLVKKIESMAELNERYLIQSTQMSALEREIHELRYSLRRTKSLSDGVDHLWQIKETEYFNLNEIIKQVKII